MHQQGGRRWECDEDIDVEARRILRFTRIVTTEKFAEGIGECLLPEAKGKATELARNISAEGDAENMVNSFQKHLPFEGEHSTRCSISEDKVAVWTVKRTKSAYLHSL